MAKLRITLACWDYDRTRALLEHRIALDGIEWAFRRIFTNPRQIGTANLP